MRDIILFEEWYIISGGDTSECFANKNDKSVLLKLFLEKFSKEEVECELKMSEKASGFILTPRVLDGAKVGNRFGILFERVNGNTLAELCIENPDRLTEYSGIFAQKLKEVCNIAEKINELPSMTEMIKDAIDDAYHSKFWRRIFGKRLAMISSEFPCEVLVHGDLHPGNIMVCQEKTYYIDMGHLSRGPAVFNMSSMDMLWNFPITRFLSSSEKHLTGTQLKEFYEIILKEFSSQYPGKQLGKMRWLVRQGMILYAIFVMVSEEWTGLIRPILKTIICLTYVFTGDEPKEVGMKR